MASRRGAERWIRAGRVTVNGRLVTEPGVRIDPASDDVRIDGRRLRPEPRQYLLLHKPRGILCTCHDPQGRRTILHLLPRTLGVRLYPVGRLDLDSEGLLLLTNDGELAARLIHPRYHVAKVYRVWTDRPLSPAWLSRFVNGVVSKGELLRAVRVRPAGAGRGGAEYEFVLIEGRNRQIRRMVECAGVQVVRLLRTRMGPLALGRLPAGRWRRLRRGELEAVRAAAGLSGDARPENAPECSEPHPPAWEGSSYNTSPSKGCTL